MFKFLPFPKPEQHSNSSQRITVLWVGLALSTFCTIFFVADVLGDMILGRDFPDEKTHQMMEMLVVILSSVSFFFHFRELKRFFRQHNRMKDQMRVATGEFSQVIEALFTEWKLTPAEKDVAIYLIKGMSFIEIATIRQAKEGTVKAQSNSLYRKAGVKGRHELLALFLDELLTDISIR